MKKKVVRGSAAAVNAASDGTTKRRKASRIVIIAVFGVLSVLSVLVCTGIGSVEIAIPDVAKALFIDDGSTARLLVWNLRFPRVLVGGFVEV